MESQNFIYCSKCGAKLPANAKFCNKCGATIATRSNPATVNLTEESTFNCTDKKEFNNDATDTKKDGQETSSETKNEISIILIGAVVLNLIVYFVFGAEYTIGGVVIIGMYFLWKYFNVSLKICIIAGLALYSVAAFIMDNYTSVPETITFSIKDPYSNREDKMTINFDKNGRCTMIQEEGQEDYSRYTCYKHKEKGFFYVSIGGGNLYYRDGYIYLDYEDMVYARKSLGYKCKTSGSISFTQ